MCMSVYALCLWGAVCKQYTYVVYLYVLYYVVVHSK